MRVAGLLFALTALASAVSAQGQGQGQDQGQGQGQITQAPVTQTPVTQAPVTQAPVTGAAVTEPPVTSPPVTTMPPTMPPAKCNALPNMDRMGFDLANTKGKLDSCWDACEKQTGCRAYTWSEYQGGTCWLKSYPGKLFDKAGVTATDCIRDTPSLICADYKDIDFVGMDIGSKPGKTAGACCDVCNEFTGCTAYAWNDFNNGTCWLKKSVGHVVAKVGTVSSSLVNIYGPVCPFEYDTDFTGNDIGNMPAADAGVCCSQCKANKDCKAYSWSNYKSGTCWMKSGKGNAVKSAGVISAALAGF